MTLLDLIRKPVSRKTAIAIPAIPATQSEQVSGRVARIATVAVANPTEAKHDRPSALAIQPGNLPRQHVAATDHADLISDFAERIAFCCEGGDVAEQDANRLATMQCGAPLVTLVTRQIEYWHLRINAVAEPNDCRLARIKDTCLEALAQQWLFEAARIGWDASELFGMGLGAHGASPQNGLFPGLALIRLHRPADIFEIGRDAAIIKIENGQRLRHFRTGRSGDPIWEHAAFCQLH